MSEQDSAEQEAARRAESTRNAIRRVGEVRAELQRVARSGSWEEKRSFLLIPVDDELQLLEAFLGEQLTRLEDIQQIT